MTKPMTRTEIKKEKTRSQLIKGALIAFEENGYHKTKVKDITEKADLGYGTFYKYFENKQMLVMQLAQDMCSHIGDYLDTTDYKSMNNRDKVYCGVRDVFSFCFSNKTTLMIIQEAKVGDECIAKCENEIFNNLFKRIKKDVDYFIHKGCCRETVGEDSVFLITCMINRGIQFKIKEEAEEKELEDTVQTLTQMIYNLLFEDDYVDSTGDSL